MAHHQITEHLQPQLLKLARQRIPSPAQFFGGVLFMSAGMIKRGLNQYAFEKDWTGNIGVAYTMEKVSEMLTQGLSKTRGTIQVGVRLLGGKAAAKKEPKRAES